MDRETDIQTDRHKNRQINKRTNAQRSTRSILHRWLGKISDRDLDL